MITWFCFTFIGKIPKHTFLIFKIRFYQHFKGTSREKGFIFHCYVLSVLFHTSATFT